MGIILFLLLFGHVVLFLCRYPDISSITCQPLQPAARMIEANIFDLCLQSDDETNNDNIPVKPKPARRTKRKTSKKTLTKKKASKKRKAQSSKERAADLSDSHASSKQKSSSSSSSSGRNKGDYYDPDGVDESIASDGDSVPRKSQKTSSRSRPKRVVEKASSKASSGFITYDMQPSGFSGRKRKVARADKGRSSRRQQAWGRQGRSGDFAQKRRGGTRYFVIKSNDKQDVDISMLNGIWATQPRNEPKLNDAFLVLYYAKITAMFIYSLFRPQIKLF